MRLRKLNKRQNLTTKIKFKHLIKLLIRKINLLLIPKQTSYLALTLVHAMAHLLPYLPSLALLRKLEEIRSVLKTNQLFTTAQ